MSFVTFEGIDGSGKTTQARRLAAWFEEQGRDVVLTREPGGSAGAEQIRQLVLEGPVDRWSPESELLLFTAARRDHIERLISPALEAGKVVICDRFVDSTRVYQGLRRDDLRACVDALHDLMIVTEPDVTLLIDTDPDAGLSRALARGGTEARFESFGLDLQRKMRQGFLRLAEDYPARIVVIDGNREIDDVARDVRAAVERHL